MKAVGKNLIIQKVKSNITTTNGGVILTNKQKEDIRYIEANIISVGDEISGLNKGDVIYFDKHAGHKIEVDNDVYHVIKVSDVVVVL
jgi:chaperonin GroES